MFCPKCGASIPDDSAYCPNCGRHVKDAFDSIRKYSPNLLVIDFFVINSKCNILSYC